MKTVKLGKSDIDISEICLGSMTWGQQNSREQAFEQMDYAVAQGINFFDNAEMYPVPPKAETQGLTEQYMGDWFTKTGKRQDIVLATKVAGRSEKIPDFTHIRGGSRLNKEHITQALEGSLKRLQTDYVDLYQLHWPERSTNYFGMLGYKQGDDDNAVSIEETLEVLSGLVASGKVRHIGLSNETPWGVHEFLRAASDRGLERVVSIQNPYNLLNRTFEVGLAEMSLREQVSMLAYSPMAFGLLSGKYANGQRPADARITLFERFQRYTGEQSMNAAGAYVNLALEHDLDPAQMALAFVTSRSFVSSNIIGATTMQQLRSNIASTELTLSKELLKAIEAIHVRYPNPAP
jgi:aryl-alcohol dehydrogenase-like predicted oxidoreductase